MAESQTTPEFTGPYKAALTELASVIDWLWSEHDKSFVKAGDDQVYAFGGDGYVLVLDERRWGGLIELITPQGALQIKPGDDGKVTVVSTETDQAVLTRILKEGSAGLKRYYENRYWSTPKTAAG
ncbi:MAG TPA: hypothetical protein VKM94_01405 [Blastocatellia bacterium]|nr:hypothetical protein [Blastocatellia bacterium]